MSQEAPAVEKTTASPTASSPVSPPADAASHRLSSTPDDYYASRPSSVTTTSDHYYASRPRFDKLGNRLPDRARAGGAMSSVFGPDKIRLPGDLGAKDPRRPKSPTPAILPGDLGAKDPRRSSSNSAALGGQADKAQHLSEAADGGVRLQEDPPEAGQEGDAGDDSDDDYEADADNDHERGRGRKRPEPGKTTAGQAVGLQEDSDSDVERLRSKIDPTKGQSYRGLLSSNDPTIKITPPNSDASTHRSRKGVHPSTAFDTGPSGANTPLHSDDESDHRAELRAAQQLALTMSNIHSTPSAHRVIRQIIRGDYDHFQREALEGRKRQRMYLVATDLSPEAEYALEWTIGTVLRDGDTLFAVYAVDDEAGTGGDGGVEIGHGADSVRDTASIVSSLSAVTSVPPPPRSPGPSPLARSSLASTDARSHSGGVSSGAETERRRMLEEVSARCIGLLRKTRLQVRVVVEVFHCKSPRHMITEVIDYLSPTLVVIGSRGRSAVKGVLLGSFSNYLVTKSSVPVMVARKKLRKHSKHAVKRFNRDGTPVPYASAGEGRMRAGRLSNMIAVPNSRGLRGKGWGDVKID